MGVSMGRRIFRFVLYAVAVLLVLLVVLFGATTAAEKGIFGTGAQTQFRLAKSRFAFNQIYSMATPPFDQAASEFLVRSVEGVVPGTALDIAAGQGRNSLYLAQ
jgi:hypothetical protein